MSDKYQLPVEMDRDLRSVVNLKLASLPVCEAICEALTVIDRLTGKIGRLEARVTAAVKACDVATCERLPIRPICFGHCDMRQACCETDCAVSDRCERETTRRMELRK